jgi:hypothetical protein
MSYRRQSIKVKELIHDLQKLDPEATLLLPGPLDYNYKMENGHTNGYLLCYCQGYGKVCWCGEA